MPRRKPSRKRLPRRAATRISKRPTGPGSRSPAMKVLAARRHPCTASRPRAAGKTALEARGWPDALRPRRKSASVPFEILHRAFVFFGGCARLERAEVTALAGLRIDLAGVKPVFAGS